MIALIKQLDSPDDGIASINMGEIRVKSGVDGNGVAMQYESEIGLANIGVAYEMNGPTPFMIAENNSAESLLRVNPQ